MGDLDLESDNKGQTLTTLTSNMPILQMKNSYTGEPESEQRCREMSEGSRELVTLASLFSPLQTVSKPNSLVSFVKGSGKGHSGCSLNNKLHI